MVRESLPWDSRGLFLVRLFSDRCLIQAVDRLRFLSALCSVFIFGLAWLVGYSFCGGLSLGLSVGSPYVACPKLGIANVW